MTKSQFVRFESSSYIAGDIFQEEKNENLQGIKQVNYLNQFHQRELKK